MMYAKMESKRASGASAVKYAWIFLGVVKLAGTRYSRPRTRCLTLATLVAGGDSISGIPSSSYILAKDVKFRDLITIVIRRARSYYDCNNNKILLLAAKYGRS